MSGLNYTNPKDASAVYTFNASYNGHVSELLSGRADATQYLPVSTEKDKHEGDVDCQRHSTVKCVWLWEC